MTDCEGAAGRGQSLRGGERSTAAEPDHADSTSSRPIPRRDELRPRPSAAFRRRPRLTSRSGSVSARHRLIPGHSSTGSADMANRTSRRARPHELLLGPPPRSTEDPDRMLAPPRLRCLKLCFLSRGHQGGGHPRGACKIAGGHGYSSEYDHWSALVGANRPSSDDLRAGTSEKIFQAAAIIATRPSG